jgi:hypothetical protein
MRWHFVAAPGPNALADNFAFHLANAANKCSMNMDIGLSCPF